MRLTIGLFFVLVLAALTQSTSAEAYYYRFAPYWGYANGYYYHASTAAEGYLNGYASFLQSLGFYNLNTATASKVYQEAYAEYLKNRYLRAETYYALKNLHDDYVKSHTRRLTPEQLKKLAQSQLPKRLTSDQWNKETFTFKFPYPLKNEIFFADCEQLTQLFKERELNPENSGLESKNYLEVKELTDSMLEKLKTLIKEYPAEQYIAAKNLLKSASYEARFAVGK